MRFVLGAAVALVEHSERLGCLAGRPTVSFNAALSHSRNETIGHGRRFTTNNTFHT